MSFNVALIGPFHHGKTMLAAALLRLGGAVPPGAVKPGGAMHRLVANGIALFEGYSGSLPARQAYNAARTPDAAYVERVFGFRHPTSGLIKILTTAPLPFELTAAARRSTAFDCPAYGELARHTLSLLAIIDAVVVVVSPLELDRASLAAIDEQLLVARHVGVASAVVFSSKVDHLAGESHAERDSVLRAAEERLRPILERHGYGTAEVVRGSAARAALGDASSLAELLTLTSAIDRLPEPPRNRTGPALFPVLRGHPIRGRGAVGTGVVARGALVPGDAVDVIGVRRSWFGRARALSRPPIWSTSVLDIRSFAQKPPIANAGDAVGVMIQVQNQAEWRDYYDVTHGIVFAQKDTARAVDHFTARLRFIEGSSWTTRSAPPRGPQGGYGPDTRYGVFILTSRETGRIEAGSTSSAGPWKPGDTITATVALETPMFVEPGLPFFACTDRLVALGEVLDLVA